MTGFIYVITNDINGKQYVGKTTGTIQERFREHCKDYLRYFTKERPLYKAMQKYGIEHFSIAQIEECDISILDVRERYWINQLNTFYNGYNATYGGDGIQLYNYDLFIIDYDSGMTGQEIAKKRHCDIQTVRRALVRSGRDTKKNANDRNICIPVIQLNKDTEEPIQEFISSRAAAIYMQKYGYTTDKRDESVSHHITDAAKGKRKSAYGFKWKLKES